MTEFGPSDSEMFGLGVRLLERILAEKGGKLRASSRLSWTRVAHGLSSGRIAALKQSNAAIPRRELPLSVTASVMVCAVWITLGLN